MATLAVSYKSIQHQSNTHPDECFENPVGGVYNGINTSYTFVKAPKRETLNLRSLKTGVLFEGVDFSFTDGRNFTITGTPLADGDYLIADYKI